jgi:uncharacterized HAD superfamily protein
LIIKNLSVLSNKYDAVVGIPRSGLVPAGMIALHLNLPLYSLNELLAGQHNKGWSSRAHRRNSRDDSGAPRFLIVDDSVNTGKSVNAVREAVAQLVPQVNATYLAVYASSQGLKYIDLYFERVEHPRAFEWNVAHHGYMADFLVDMDGILCKDGPPENSNDAGQYLSYITNAIPKILISTTIGAIVTSRLEKYRDVTEDWLIRHGIKYKQLIMLNVESAERRRELAVHGRYKADVYKAIGGLLFIESEEWQARAIAKTTEKPVLWYDNSVIF